MPEEYEVPQIQTGDGISLQALGGKPLVFTQVEVESSRTIVSLRFKVGPHSLSVGLARGAARELMERLATQLEASR